MASDKLSSDLRDIVDWVKKWLLDFNTGKTQLVWFDPSNNNGMVLLRWKWMGLFLRKNHLLKYWGWLSLLNWIGALTLSLLKLLSPEVALYLYKSTILPCMEYCCHIWPGAPNCYMELLYKLQKWICRTVGCSLAASRQNMASLSLFYRDYFSRCSCQNWFHFLFLEVGLLVVLIDYLVFLSPFLDL